MEHEPSTTTSHILTPDQRVRVFVSSTLVELLEERNAAREAIERLRLAPVMFELGARPHPPRTLYRAYLEQSQIFVGIYWQRYGWVAPGERISGLEDEYDLSGDRPKLIYVKHPAAEREARLADLLGRIQRDDRVSYKPFTTPVELRELIENDLALLLTERFEMARRAGATPEPAGRRALEPLPTPATKLVGRATAIEELQRLLTADGVRLVTLVGPGGIGKTRLALAVAEQVRDAFPDGVAFVPLAAVRDGSLVPAAVAERLGLKLEGGGAALDALGAHLRDKRMLLVLDNFEQVASAAPAVAELQLAAPGVRVLVTSRVALRLSAERLFAVPPLGLPAGTQATGDAVELFLERARAAGADPTGDAGSLAAVADIVRRLDGLPLGIELAAARARLLPPRKLLERLERRFDVLTSGPRDLPERQQTMRATLDWSYDLLTPRQRDLLARLGAFMGGFTLEAVEAVVSDGTPGEDALDALDALVGHSLVQVLPGGAEGRFALLETVREYAAGKLASGAAGDPAAVRERHMQYYLALCERLGPRLKVAQSEALASLAVEQPNVRLTVAWCLDEGRCEEVARFAWALWLYWWIRNEQDRVLPWLERTLAADLDDRYRLRAQVAAGALHLRRGDVEAADALVTDSLPRARACGDAETEALLLSGAGLAALARRDYDTAERDNRAALELFGRMGDAWGIAFARVALARVALGKGDPQGAVALATPLVEPTLAAGDENTAAWLLHVLGLAEAEQGRLPEAAAHLGACLELFWRLDNPAGTAHVVGSIAGLALASGDTAEALRLGAAAQALGDAVGALPFQPEGTIFERTLAAARAMTGAEGASLEAQGRALPLDAMLAVARRRVRVTAE